MRSRLGIFGVILLLALSACGSTAAQSTSTGTSGTNTTLPTQSTGPVSIRTDHSAYAPTDIITALVNNGLAAPIYTYDFKASCTILSMQQQTSNGWQDISQLNAPRLAGCPLGRPTMQVTIAPGASNTAAIRAGYLRQGDAAFPTGTYRLVLQYSAKPFYGNTTPVTYVEVDSQPFNISTSVPAQPTPTPVPPGSGSGTSVTGTVVPVGTTHP